MTERGGARPGAGRPPKYENSDKVLQALIEAETASVGQGKPSMAECLVKIAKSGDKRAALPAMRLFFDKVLIPTSQHDVEPSQSPGILFYDPEKGTPPEDTDAAVCLPISQPDPGKVVPLDTGDVE